MDSHGGSQAQDSLGQPRWASFNAYSHSQTSGHGQVESARTKSNDWHFELNELHCTVLFFLRKKKKVLVHALALFFLTLFNFFFFFYKGITAGTETHLEAANGVASRKWLTSLMKLALVDLMAGI